MKILLAAVNAKYIHSNLAVYSLKRYAKRYEESVEMAEYTINQSREDILKNIYQRKPEVVCFSCYIWNIAIVRELTRELTKIMPNIEIWLGGPEVSYDARQEFEISPEITGIMIGEGEATFLELVQTYVEGRRDFEKIAGLAYHKEHEVYITQPREIMNLSEIPFPYEELEIPEHRIVYYESSRGCPFSCSYCLSSIDKKLRFRSLDLVKKELEFFIDRKVPQVKFVDRTFNCNHAHAMEIWRFLIEKDNQITNFHFEVAADLLNEEEIALIQTMRPGLIQLEIGVQSTNEDTVKAILRTMDFAKVSQVVEKIHENKNIHQHLDLIAGLPFEDYESFHSSFLDVYRLRPDQLQLGFLKVLKGSFMYEHAKEYECVYSSFPPYEVLSTKWLSFDEVLRLKMVEEMVEVYYNSGQFFHTLLKCEQYFDDVFVFYEKLGQYYEEMGYDTISHSRLRRYDILLEFLAKQENVDVEACKDRMLFDLYLRENLKSRPAWAVNRIEEKAKIRQLYQELELRQDSNTHIEKFLDGWYLFDYRQKNPLDHNVSYRKLEEFS